MGRRGYWVESLSRHYSAKSNFRFSVTRRFFTPLSLRQTAGRRYASFALQSSKRFRVVPQTAVSAFPTPPLRLLQQTAVWLGHTIRLFRHGRAYPGHDGEGCAVASAGYLSQPNCDLL